MEKKKEQEVHVKGGRGSDKKQAARRTPQCKAHSHQQRWSLYSSANWRVQFFVSCIQNLRGLGSGDRKGSHHSVIELP